MFQLELEREDNTRNEITTLNMENTILREQLNIKKSELERCEEMQTASRKKEIEYLRKISNLEHEKQRTQNEAESYKMETRRTISLHENIINECLKKEATSRNEVSTLMTSKGQLEEELVTVTRSKEELQVEVDNLMSEYNNSLDKCNKLITNLTQALAEEKQVTHMDFWKSRYSCIFISYLKCSHNF
jgi:uncharacterized protein (DUF3084 family)